MKQFLLKHKTALYRLVLAFGILTIISFVISSSMLIADQRAVVAIFCYLTMLFVFLFIVQTLIYLLVE